jgi:2-oxoisovalerate dehydrogenase E1 component alpha subunit
MPGCVVDGSDPRAVYAAACQAADLARSGGGPTFVEIKVYRFMPHTSNDDDRRYRTRTEVEQARLNDPLTRFHGQLVDEALWDEALDQALREELQAIVDEALAFAEASPAPGASDMWANVYEEVGSKVVQRGSKVV